MANERTVFKGALSCSNVRSGSANCENERSVRCGRLVAPLCIIRCVAEILKGHVEGISVWSPRLFLGAFVWSDCEHLWAVKEGLQWAILTGRIRPHTFRKRAHNTAEFDSSDHPPALTVVDATLLARLGLYCFWKEDLSHVTEDSLSRIANSYDRYRDRRKTLGDYVPLSGNGMRYGFP